MATEWVLSPDITRISLSLHWQSLTSTDISYTIYVYDDAASLIHKISSATNTVISLNYMAGAVLETSVSTEDFLFIKCMQDSLGDKCIINLSQAKEAISLMLVVDEKPIYNDNDILIINARNGSDYSSNELLFETRKRFKNEFKKLICLVIYLKRSVALEVNTGGGIWIARSMYDPVLSFALSEVEQVCTHLVIDAVLAYGKFKRKAFNDISQVCTAMTTQDLLSLKVYFESQSSGLQIHHFCEILFMALANHHPKVLEPDESCFLVALLHELFYQIDIDQNHSVSWSEFCDFCIAFSSINQTDCTYNRPAVSSRLALDEVLVEYEEARFARDGVLSTAALAVCMRHYAELHRIIVVQENSRDIFIFDHNYSLSSRFRPEDVVDENLIGPVLRQQSVNHHAWQKEHKVIVYDALYIAEDLGHFIVFCADDYSITIARERSILDGNKTIYKLHNKILHNLVHHKLCWSGSSRILCSIASNQQIYGWKLDGKIPAFQVTRHTDVITGFISVDASDLFITCSMDKRIVLWSASNQRVKGILEGHSRGIRCIHSSSKLLLSGSFDCDGRVWDVVTKECRVILQGHRRSITAACFMDQNAISPADIRVFTVDEVGEVRFWAALSQERFRLAPTLSALQVFQMYDPQVPLNRIQFLSVIGDHFSDKSIYGRLVACGSKLLSFVPVKKFKEFSPANCVCYVSQMSYVMTAVGNGIITYDVSSGAFKGANKNVWPTELTSFHFSGGRARALYIGTVDGTLIAYCFRSSSILTYLTVCEKEISCIATYRRQRDFIAVGSLDGSVRLIEECKLKLSSSTYMLANVFRRSARATVVPIADLCMIEDFDAMIIMSTTNTWGIWSIFSTSIGIEHSEDAPLTGLRLIGHNAYVFEDSHCRMVTFCVSTAKQIYIYTVDVLSNTLSVSFILGIKPCMHFQITSLLIFHLIHEKYINYDCYIHATDSLKYHIIACTDDGSIVEWIIPDLLHRSEEQYKNAKGIKSEFGITVLPDIGLDVESLRKQSKRRCSITIRRRVSGSIGMLPRRVWHGHSDAIVTSIGFEDSGCFITVSSDGFQRIWNLEATCLGELLLPNVPQELKMNKLTVYKSSKWLYCAESLLFTYEQQETSLRYVEMYRSICEDIDTYFRLLLCMEHPNNTVESEKTTDKIHRIPSSTESETRGKALIEATKQQGAMNANLASIALSLEIPLEQEKAIMSNSFRLPTIDTCISPSVTPSVVIPFDASSLFSPMKSCRLVPKASFLSRPSTSDSVKPITDMQSRPGTSSGQSDRPSTRSTIRPKSSYNKESSSNVNNALWNAPTVGAPAFSESSLTSSYHAGLIDTESFNMLQQYGKAYGSKPGFSRTLLLRNPQVVAQVNIPTLDEASMSELSFGSQSKMYTHANAQIARKKRIDPKLTQSLITLSRIERDVKQAKSSKMVAMMDLSLDMKEKGLLIEPKPYGNQLLREEMLSNMRIQKSSALIPEELEAASFYDIDSLRSGMEAAVASQNKEVQREITRGYNAMKLQPKLNQGTCKKITPDDGRMSLEKKLQTAIMEYYNISKASQTKMIKKKLKTRDLLPYYGLKEVEQFLEIFATVDVDANGAIDIGEWISIFSAIDSALPLHEVIGMFDGVDTRMEGLLMLSDLIPMLFSKATRDQKKLITQYAESHIFSSAAVGKHLKVGDLQRLFESYDTGCLGFIPVTTIKDRLSAMQFPPYITVGIIDRFLGVNNDEYLNLPEFVKIFRPYCI